MNSPVRRLNTSLHRFYYRHFSRTRHKIVRFMGAEFVVRPDNYIDRRLWAEGGYEKAQLAFMTEEARTKKFDAFLDIGANFGLYSCILGAAGAIPVLHSFECDTRNLYQLYGHLRMNGLTGRVMVHPFALGDRECDLSFRPAADDSTGKSRVDADGSVTVKQYPLDKILSLEKQALLIKIDVEGYEENVLKGMQRTLAANECFIQMEILDDDPRRIETLLPADYKNVHRIGQDWYFSNIRELA